jgi:hypothetical protein
MMTGMLLLECAVRETDDAKNFDLKTRYTMHTHAAAQKYVCRARGLGF